MHIYRIYNVKNNKSYIGLSRNVNKRLIKHFSYLRHNTHTNTHLQSSFNKYGETSFKHEILQECIDQNELSEQEKYYIDLYKSNDSKYGYNLTSGGEVNFNVSDETRLKLSLANKDKILSDDHKQKIKQSHLLLCKIISDEQKEKSRITYAES